MGIKEQIEEAKQQEIFAHRKKIAAFDSLLALIDPTTGDLPDLLRSGIITALTSKETKPAVRPLNAAVRPLNGIENAILARISELGDVEWTSSQVRQILEDQGYNLPSNHDAAMNAISNALSYLMEIGKIDRVYQGRGRDPHRYRVRREVMVEEPLRVR